MSKIRLPKGLFNKFLAGVEKAGNALPHPATIFALFALGVIVASSFADLLNSDLAYSKVYTEP